MALLHHRILTRRPHCIVFCSPKLSSVPSFLQAHIQHAIFWGLPPSSAIQYVACSGGPPSATPNISVWDTPHPPKDTKYGTATEGRHHIQGVKVTRRPTTACACANWDQWMSQEHIRLIDARASLRRLRLNHNRNQAMTLICTVWRPLIMEYQRQLEAAMEKIGA